jgi:UDP-N-acetylmuramyl pentapeptide phosphotransferase/UDP-N-acetylglucosamine-1-phosphate transferase
LAGVATLLGFMAINYPFGFIFMGDGGAYLMGFWLAECAVLLLARNPDVSTWAVLLSCVYPVWETAFSMYRRNVIRRVSSGRPDAVHLHHLLLRRFVVRHVGLTAPTWAQHGITSLIIWGMVAACQAFAIISYSSTITTAAGVIMFAVFYQGMYAGLVQGCMAKQLAHLPRQGIAR